MKVAKRQGNTWNEIPHKIQEEWRLKRYETVYKDLLSNNSQENKSQLESSILMMSLTNNII